MLCRCVTGLFFATNDNRCTTGGYHFIQTDHRRTGIANPWGLANLIKKPIATVGLSRICKDTFPYLIGRMVSTLLMLPKV